MLFCCPRPVFGRSGQLVCRHCRVGLVAEQDARKSVRLALCFSVAPVPFSAAVGSLYAFFCRVELVAEQDPGRSLKRCRSGFPHASQWPPVVVASLTHSSQRIYLFCRAGLMAEQGACTGMKNYPSASGFAFTTAACGGSLHFTHSSQPVPHFNSAGQN